MATINDSIAVVNGKPVDKVYSNDKIVYSRNYLVSKTAVPGYISVGYIFTSDVNGLVYDAVSTKAGDKWTVTQWLDKPWEYPDSDGSHFRNIHVSFLDKNGQWVNIQTYNDMMIYPPNLTYFTGAIDVPDNEAIAFIRVSIDYMDGGRGHAKLEKGTQATDWTPAVEDVI